MNGVDVFEMYGTCPLNDDHFFIFCYSPRNRAFFLISLIFIFVFMCACILCSLFYSNFYCNFIFVGIYSEIDAICFAWLNWFALYNVCELWEYHCWFFNFSSDLIWFSLWWFFSFLNSYGCLVGCAPCDC